MSNRFTQFLAGSVITTMLLLGCAGLGGFSSPVAPEQQLVVTTQNQVKPTTPANQLVVFSENAVPSDLAEAFGISETNKPVITQVQYLIDPVTDESGQTVNPIFVPVESTDLTSSQGWGEFLANPAVGTALGALGGTLGPVAPWIIGLEAALTLFSERKRTNYTKAAKSAVKLNPGETITNLVRALGAMHTESPKEPEVKQVISG